jgi:hypothetical protein
MRTTRSIGLGLLPALAVTIALGPPAVARDGDLASHTSAALTAKQQCTRTCRDRYRDCRHEKQVPVFECQGVYQDCTRYACTGLGPG